MNNNPIICAIDYANFNYAYKLSAMLTGKIAAIKLGLEFFTACGIEGVKKISGLGIPIFLDLKLHDIPNTVAKTAKILKNLDIFILTAHISGGKTMLKALTNELENTKIQVIGVTILTSLATTDMKDMNISLDANQQAVQLAKIAKISSLNGVVCSGYEVTKIRQECGKNFILVTPGVRPSSCNQDDHKRSLTPSEALNAGADYLVIGRPITNSNDPIKAVEEILNEI
ncbi:MAG: orotidine-5'-phosphate decarboxylase [Rickettsiaceae bacterium H1]|nr:orotidine-5'-phosphate decarboxylase [Rickettsiaceae bacterium H1]